MKPCHFVFLSSDFRNKKVWGGENGEKGKEEEPEHGACYGRHDCHCHSNVLLHGGNLRVEQGMDTNGNQLEERNNWI